jgi:peptidoglycan/LPS O-acetylase OafA/YrhL
VHLSVVIPLIAKATFLHWTIAVPLYLMLTIALSTMIYKYFEQPAMNLREILHSGSRRRVRLWSRIK